MRGTLITAGFTIPTGQGKNGRNRQMDIDNNIFTQATGRVIPSAFGGLTKGVVFMSTYEEFMIILTTVSVIIAILNYMHKK